MKKFKIVIYCAKGEHQKRTAQQLLAGFKRHGWDDVTITSDTQTASGSDLAIFWGHRKKSIIAAQKKARRDYMVMERAYIGDRFLFISLGYNGLNGNADFCNKQSPPDRWNKHFGESWLKPWKEGGEYILLCGQVPRDASVKHISISQWLSYMSYHARKKYPGVPIRFRPHPQEEKRGRSIAVRFTKFVKGRSLAEDLAGAKLAVTYNSNSGVDAVLAGVPTLVANKGGMAYPMAIHDLKVAPIRPDRTQWAYDMAYTQWLPEEIENGEAWANLKKRYE